MDWDQVKYFLYIAKTGSLSRAAKALKVNHSTVSRRIKALEKMLKTRLFDKMPTGIKLTASGDTLLKHALVIEGHINSARQALKGQGELLCGTIRISTEDTFGFHILPDLLDKFRKKYPHVVLDLNITSSFANLTHREADIVITARKKPPEHLVGRHLGPIKMILTASHRYLQRFGTPETMKDLSQHRILCPNETLGHLKIVRWIHKNIPEENIVFMSDKLLSLFHMAKRHVGIAVLPHNLIKHEKDLVPLIPLPENCGSDAWVLTHPDLKETLTIKTFIKYIGDNLKI